MKPRFFDFAIWRRHCENHQFFKFLSKPAWIDGSACARYHVTKLSEVWWFFTATPSKLKMETQYRKSRIWEMKEDKYTKALPRIRSVWYFICDIFGKTFYQNLSSFVYKAQIWPLESNRNISFCVFLLTREFFAWGTHKG